MIYILSIIMVELAYIIHLLKKDNGIHRMDEKWIKASNEPNGFLTVGLGKNEKVQFIDYISEEEKINEIFNKKNG